MCQSGIYISLICPCESPSPNTKYLGRAVVGWRCDTPPVDTVMKLFNGLGGVKIPQTGSSSRELEAHGMMKNKRPKSSHWIIRYARAESLSAQSTRASHPPQIRSIWGGPGRGGVATILLLILSWNCFTVWVASRYHRLVRAHGSSKPMASSKIKDPKPFIGSFVMPERNLYQPNLPVQVTLPKYEVFGEGRGEVGLRHSSC